MMGKYDVSNLAKRITVGSWVYPGGKEHQVIDKFKEASNMDGKSRPGPTTIWWVALKNNEGVKAYPLTEVARNMLG
jgi:hypothetical protein